MSAAAVSRHAKAWPVTVFAWWAMLAALAALGGSTLSTAWPAWRWAVTAAAVWGLNLLLLLYGVGPPFHISRPPLLAAGFALLMTLLGSGSYWATIQLYPWYRVGIERAACFVALCTTVALGVAVVAGRILREHERSRRLHLEWDWARLAAVNILLFVVAAVGTLVAIRRIGYVPILAGDPLSARVEFPAIGGVWYRLSMLGGVVALLVAAQAAARRATAVQYALGCAGLAMVGSYGPRFFVVLPLGVAVLLWDRVRVPVRLFRVTILVLLMAPILALIALWRERDVNVPLLQPIAILFYGTLGEFRDLGWALDHYSLGDRFLSGDTLGSLVVPLLPSAVWRLVGIDKAAIYAQNSASVLADAMGQTTGQRIGAYGEFFMNFGWTGALVGAALYGVLLGYLSHSFREVRAQEVRAIVLALALAVTVFAQIGQLNMFTSTLTGLGYPVALVALVAARRASV
jgi:hypothetical protein